MTEKEKNEKVLEYKTPLTAKSIVVSSIFLALSIPLSTFAQLYSGGLFLKLMFPFLYIAWFNVLLGKISPKLKLNEQEMTLLLTCWMFGMMSQFMGAGFPPSNWFTETSFFSGGFMLVNPAMKQYFANWVPSYMFPSSDLALSAIQNGLRPGQSLPWGEFFVPIVYWTAYMTLVWMLHFFLAFGVWGRRWVEVENLTFPVTVPTLYSIEASVDVDKQTNKSRWFSLRDPAYKVFWVSFFVGIPLASIPLMAQFFPSIIGGLPGGVKWGEVGTSLPLANVLPGAHLYGIFMVDQFAVWLLLPVNSLATIVLVWLVVEVIATSSAVQTGILPRVPGGEYLARLPYGMRYPFPYDIVWLGAAIGVAIVTLWSLRGRFRELFNALKGEDRNENGLSLRFMAIFGIVVTLALVGFFIGSGVPPIIAVIMVGTAYIGYTFLARFASTFYVHIADFFSMGGPNYYWYTGAVLGYWPSGIPQVSTQTYAAFATTTMQCPLHSGGPMRTGGFSPGGITGIYKIAYETKTHLKHLLLAALVIVIVGTVIKDVSYLWFISHAGGITRTGASVGAVQGKYNMGVFGFTIGITGENRFEAVFPWHLLGMAIFFIVYFMRIKFTWFWLDPIAIAYTLPFSAWHWLPALVALIVKFSLLRVIGATRYSRYAKHFASGVVMGFAAPVVFVWIYNFATTMLPNFQSLYVP